MVHVTVVIALITVVWVATITKGPEDGVLIGLFLFAEPLLALGLPWSWPAISNPYQYDGLSPIAWNLATFGPAMLNVILHGLVLVAFGRIRRR